MGLWRCVGVSGFSGSGSKGDGAALARFGSLFLSRERSTPQLRSIFAV